MLTKINDHSMTTKTFSNETVSFVDSVSDWYSASVPAIIYALSYYIGPRYNGTRLYLSLQRCTKTVDAILKQNTAILESIYSNNWYGYLKSNTYTIMMSMYRNVHTIGHLWIALLTY